MTISNIPLDEKIKSLKKLENQERYDEGYRETIFQFEQGLRVRNIISLIDYINRVGAIFLQDFDYKWILVDSNEILNWSVNEVMFLIQKERLRFVELNNLFEKKEEIWKKKWKGRKLKWQH